MNLFSAIQSEDPDMFQKAIDAGADVNKRDASGHTPLTFAAYWGAVDFVVKLLNAGADINATNKYGETALHAALDLPDAEDADMDPALVDLRADVANTLIDRGANATIKDNNGKTPYDVAVSNGFDEIAKKLAAATTTQRGGRKKTRKRGRKTTRRRRGTCRR